LYGEIVWVKLGAYRSALKQGHVTIFTWWLAAAVSRWRASFKIL
jgi:hypothetical protein